MEEGEGGCVKQHYSFVHLFSRLLSCFYLVPCIISMHSMPEDASSMQVQQELIKAVASAPSAPGYDRAEKQVKLIYMSINLLFRLIQSSAPPHYPCTTAMGNRVTNCIVFFVGINILSIILYSLSQSDQLNLYLTCSHDKRRSLCYTIILK